MTLPPRKKPLARSPLVRKRATPRTWKCGLCVVKNPTTRRSCEGCGTRRGTGRRSMGARLGTMWSAMIRGLLDGACARCRHHHAGQIQAAHIIRRARSHNTRWHPKNGLPLCDRLACGCHYWFDEQASERERLTFLEQTIGTETYDELHRLKSQPWDKDLGAIYEVLAGFTAGSQK